MGFSVTGVPGGADDTDVTLDFVLTNVLELPSLSDYTGQVLAGAHMRLTDRVSGAAWKTEFTFGFHVPCEATADTSLGGECRLLTTMDALIPGAAPEGTRAVWAVDQFKVRDAGSDGDPNTAGDNSLLAGTGSVRAVGLRGEELVEQPVEPVRALDHRHVAGVFEDLLARAGDQALVLVAPATGTIWSLRPHTISVGTRHVGQPVAEVVVEIALNASRNPCLPAPLEIS